MGGSGGGGYFSETGKTPSEIAKKIRDQETSAQNAIFDSEVASVIRNLVSDINNRDTDTLQSHLSNIKNAIVSDIEGTIDLRYGGSVSKHTYIDGLSDIDSLAILNKS